MVPAVFAGADIWAAALTTLGYVSWQSFDQAQALAMQGTLALIAVVIVAVLLVTAYRNVRIPERRKRLPTGCKHAWSRITRGGATAPRGESLATAVGE